MDTVNSHLLDAFTPMEDFRMVSKCDHKLIDIIALSICAVICGSDTWVDVHNFGVAKQDWLKKFLELPNGIPSHDTIGRVFSMLNPVKFEACFLSWIESVFKLTGGQIIPVDGKTLRGSYDRKSGKAAIHMVSAWGAENGVVLGQIKTEEKSNEITAIPNLIELLDIHGCIVTIDAMGCQKEITKKIMEDGGDYVIAVKENQPTLYNEVVDRIDEALMEGKKASNIIDFHETIDSGHGRQEIRRYYILDEIDDVESACEWKGLSTIGMVETIRVTGDNSTTNRRYYIASIEKDAELFGTAVRKHWGIENSLHWVLDVSFREDECRVRKNNAAENFSVLRRVALNLLKNEKTAKLGVKSKRNKAAWDEKYLEKVIEI